MTDELEVLLVKLSGVNDTMSDLGSSLNGAAIHHTFQRHRDILLDYKQVCVALPMTVFQCASTSSKSLRIKAALK